MQKYYSQKLKYLFSPQDLLLLYSAVWKGFYLSHYFFKLEWLSWSLYFWKGYALFIKITKLDLNGAQRNQKCKNLEGKE